ncbi:hypothetical protein COY14_01615 [Candidatus Roizmanbacteria bacterium CG_4_10_14_0_2_um_filter_36_9]|uniref:Big-1 domain-containing protein n=1 Tax=Candidatus Roizmanbacteria bacterium CG_4_10_14_0_2_um_filter_36_9 TaxID=1974823 RepID=A0A2M7U4V5_9BACT|nr:MAG: hypothetical protein COY14_01615 [Candidatus Roizmanbacteria bacterium CG_4_10_14_0_2_um_filter_36_9]
MDKKLIGFSVVFFAAFIVFAAYMFSDGSIARFTRAAEDKEPSLSNSLIFAWPLQLPADNQSVSEITVFLRNAEGTGLFEQPVKIAISHGKIKESQILTDTDGKASFHISASTPGTSVVEAFVRNKRLAKTISVQFR